MDISGYDAFDEIGRGASSTVYRARQMAFDRIVALKVVSAAGIGEDARRRFDRECRAIGNLGWHPRVVPVYDAGIGANGHPYLVMEYLPGGTLAQRVQREGRLPERTVVSLGVQVADALAAAHAVGVLHRDVKPGNVLVGHFGDAKLADFGIASLTTAQTSVTDAFVGTVSFMAPELLKGERASEASDVYSLGSTLFTLLAARAAFGAATDESPLASIMRVANDPLPDLRAEGVSDAVATVIERAMAKEPSARIPTAAKLVTVLQVAAVERGWDREPTYADRARPDAGASAPYVVGAAADVEETVFRPDRQAAGPVSDEDEDLDATCRRVPVAPVPAPPTVGADPTVLRPAVVAPMPVGPPPGAQADGVRDGGPPAPPPSPELDAPSSPRRGRLLAVAGAAVVVVLLVAGAAFARGGGGGGSDEAADAATTTEIPTTTTDAPTTTSRPRPTTTVPRAASIDDIAKADPTGTYNGAARNTQCEGVSEDTDCNGEGPTSLRISCLATGCEVHLEWGVETIVIPLQFNGTEHVGRIENANLGWTCGTNSDPVLSTVDFRLRTVDAEFRGGAWRTGSLTGKYHVSNPPGACRGAELDFDVLYQN